MIPDEQVESSLNKIGIDISTHVVLFDKLENQDIFMNLQGCCPILSLSNKNAFYHQVLCSNVKFPIDGNLLCF